MIAYNSHPAKNVKSQKANGYVFRCASAFLGMPRKANTVPRTHVARRVKLTRLALEYGEQAAFAETLNVSPSGYNQWETGARSLSMRGARLICSKHSQVTIEWLLDGIADRLPHALALKIQALESTVPLPSEK